MREEAFEDERREDKALPPCLPVAPTIKMVEEDIFFLSV